MKSLLFILDIGFDRGGPSVHLLQDVIRAGLADGNEIEVILKDTNGSDKTMPDDFVKNPNFMYYAIKEVNDEKKQGFAARYLNEVKYAKKCSKYYLKQKKYDAVFLQSNTTAFFYMRLLKKLKCRIVFNVQDIFPYNLMLSGQLPFERIMFPVFRKLQNLAYKRADSIITISDDMKQTLVRDGVESNKIYVVYNWSYADSLISFDKISIENKSKIVMDQNLYNIVYAGNIGKMQNVELIAETARELKNEPQIHFYIIGDGSNMKSIRDIVKGLDNVSLYPIQPAKYAESIYAQADLNIIPLMPGGIKTALPSKTATVLRVNKPVLFCIDDDSEFANFCSQLDGTEVFGVNKGKSKELAKRIKEIYYRQLSDQNKIDRTSQLKRFTKSNSYRYIEMLCCDTINSCH